MGYRVATVKMLWSKSAGRCSICREELHLAGEGTIGEMAHIVARSDEGPRGDSPMEPADRDKYANLILLCPNHHAEVDTEVDEWPIEKLHEVKQAHEDWVRRGLGDKARSILEKPADRLVTERLDSFTQTDRSWAYLSVSPLELEEDLVDPLTPSFRASLEEHELPQYVSSLGHFRLNSNGIEPSARGLVAEERRNLDDSGVAVRVEAFRNGHLEYAVCVDGLLNWMSLSEMAKQTYRGPAGLEVRRPEDYGQLLPFEGWVEIVASQFDLLSRLFQAVPVSDALVTAAVVNCKSVAMCTIKPQPRVGRPAETPSIMHRSVFQKAEVPFPANSAVIERMVQSFGFLLQGEDEDPRMWKAVGPRS